jgi:recombination DNA repair RAD52 pathway protein
VLYAYRAVYADQIAKGAAIKVQQATVADIKARGTRPIENGVSGNAPAQIAPMSAKSLTKDDHKRINQQIARGVPFSFKR